MSRLRDEPWRLNPSNYLHEFDLRAMFGDMDSFGHLNNVALARMLEEGRVSLTTTVAGTRYFAESEPAFKLFLANLAIDYVNQGEYPGTVKVASAITKVGRSAIHQAGALFQNGQCVALAQSVLVHIASGKPAAMSDALRLRLAQYQSPLSE
jgi:acyl-CoA thioester hydrolase